MWVYTGLSYKVNIPCDIIIISTHYDGKKGDYFSNYSLQ